MKRKQYIIFGGSFDPIHKGHVSVVDLLSKRYPDATIFVMPSQNRLKSLGIVPITARIESTKAVFENYKNVIVVDWTLHWDTSSTYEVFKKISGIYVDCEIMIAGGEDILSSVERWKFFPEVATEIKWIILSRHGGKEIHSVADANIKKLISSADIINVQFDDISSTAIRNSFPEHLADIPQVALPFISVYFKKEKKN